MWFLAMRFALVAPALGGGFVNRISVWNWNTLSRKFARRFSDSITSLSYSEKGTYLIVGTATVDGAVFIRAANGTIVNKLTDNTGIVSMIQTSATEKTAVMYSPAGNLSYYNLLTGKTKQRFSVEQGLEQPVMFSNSLFLAGVRDNIIYIIHALTGKTIATVKCENPESCGCEVRQSWYGCQGAFLAPLCR